jgi:hypothetical protein
MLISQTALAVIQAAEESGDPAVNPWLVGGGILLFLLCMLGALVLFGGGRDHT